MRAVTAGPSLGWHSEIRPLDSGSPLSHTFPVKKYILRRDITPHKQLLDYEKELNEEQLAVVTAPDGPILVIAGAGSGKTRVVTYRVAYLLERGISPQSILLLTFTNKAAREMLHRVEHLIKMDTRYIWGGTFHHIGNLILRQNSQRIDYRPNFVILDNEDAKDMIELATKEAGIDTRERRFPKGQVLKEIFSYSANTMEDLEKAVQTRYPYFLDILDRIDACPQGIRREEEGVERHGLR